MSLQPVEATLIAASVSAVVSTFAVIVTHLLTRKRDRMHRIWDRRADAYVEVVRSARTMATGRRDVLREKELPSGSLDSGSDQRTMLLTEARLDLFGTEEVKALHQVRLECFKSYVIALIEWRDMSIIPNAQKEPAGQRDIARKWAMVERRIAEFDAADDALVEAIRRETRFRKPKRQGWSRLAFWRD
ncbi:hypothetical protein G3I55_21365 [Streptomyces sp. SID6648]|uniref:hypothetical protein n=1 Tax=Streptomyces TaxID=1883 RepID=UPI000BEFF4CE|nr:hypothetical protein [Streptomyces sp. ms115]NED04210.1 hypothetical protein [Streptomyces sp. SID6648]